MKKAIKEKNIDGDKKNSKGNKKKKFKKAPKKSKLGCSTTPTRGLPASSQMASILCLIGDQKLLMV